MSTSLAYREDFDPVMSIEEEDAIEIPVSKIRADVRKAARTLTPMEARYVVDSYYQMQENRKRSANQRRSLVKAGEPNLAVSYLATESERIEGEVKYMLKSFADARPVGEWAQSIVGIGPIIAAGLIAHIDIAKCQTVGPIWRYAGLDPTIQWLGKDKVRKIVSERLTKAKPTEDDFRAIAQEVRGISFDAAYRIATVKKDGSIMPLTRDRIIKSLSLRPWNASLRTLCWKIGESFVKVSNKEGDIYGHMYARQKAFYIEQNEQGAYEQYAILRAAQVGSGTDAYGYYSKGLLPPGHIYSRAKRWTTKMFLSHWHHVAYQVHYGTTPPRPFVIEHMGHSKEISPPNWPLA